MQGAHCMPPPRSPSWLHESPRGPHCREEEGEEAPRDTVALASEGERRSREGDNMREA